LRKSVVPRDKRRRDQDPLAYSLANQRDKLTAALGGEHEFVGFAEDEDISGSVSAFRRPDLGPWFDRLDEWDALAIARFDRISRSVRDFSDLCDWLRDHGKILICLNPPIDLSTPGGRAFAQMLAVFAEYERELIRERVRDSWHALADAGKWPGGAIPYGRIPVKDVPEGWILAPDPELAPVVREMVRRFLGGESFRSIARWLNAEGYPPSRDIQRLRREAQHARESGQEPPPEVINGKGWSAQAVRKVLSSPSLGGYISSHGELRRDADNVAIRIDPLIPDEDYERLQADLRDRGYSRQCNASSLLGVARCAMCASPLYQTVTRAGTSREHRYYICDGYRQGQCRAGRIPAADLEKRVEKVFLAAVGSQEIMEPRRLVAVDYSSERAGVDEAIEHLENQYAAGKVYQGAKGAERFAAMMTRLDERRARLAAEATRPPEPEYLPSGVTFAQRWADRDLAGRRLLMYESGFRFYFARVPLTADEYAARLRQKGLTRTARQLRLRAANIRFMMTRPDRPMTAERLAALQAELEQIEAERQRLREIPRYTQYVMAPLDDELARRAGLAASGQQMVLPPGLIEGYEEAAAPAMDLIWRHHSPG
jgi:site-specific DNA recombinase